MQKFQRIYDYIHEYQSLVYDYYSKIAVAYLVTYYNLDKDETVWDDTDLFGGSYERTGTDLSGIKRNKILLLPVFFPEEVSTVFDGQETGYHKVNETSFVMPSTYGITPYPGDIVKLEQEYLNPTDDTYPLFIVEGVEISVNTERRFWKIKLKTFENQKVSAIDVQVTNTYAFMEYDKTIHTLEDSALMTKLLYKNSLLRENLKHLYDDNSGFYLI